MIISFFRFLFVYQFIVQDGGPLYQETLLSKGGIVEPWNAFSSLAFLIPVIVFLLRAKGAYAKNIFLVFWCAPLLLAGGIGSTIYHAFRFNPFWMYLDVLPIVILTLSVSFYFLYRIIGKWWLVTLILGVSLIIRFTGFSYLPVHTAINLSYFINGCLIFIPAILYLRKCNYTAWIWLLTSVLTFSVALFFRYYDLEVSVFKQGTHWLWHMFCSAGALCLGEYIFRTLKRKETST